MSNFQNILETLPSVDHLARIELYQEGAEQAAEIIENKPGQAGSLRVYNAVVGQSRLDAESALVALELYGEHVDDAMEHPGKHPNIDRLLHILRDNLRYRVVLIEK